MIVAGLLIMVVRLDENCVHIKSEIKFIGFTTGIVLTLKKKRYKTLEMPNEMHAMTECWRLLCHEDFYFPIFFKNL